MSALAFRAATDLAAALRAKRLSSRELLAYYEDRIARHNPRLNAVVSPDFERARRRAAAADAATARGESWGPLHGLPMTIKDTYEVAGMRTTAGAPRYADHVSTADAIVAQRLVAAGAILFAKTNVPLMAGDLQTFNEIFGTTNNPWDTRRTPGGSSGGAAAAVAAGLTSAEVGSDIGGSIRVPAHNCGVFGHKPSWGLVPQRGHIPGPPGMLGEPDINVCGPIARSASDLSLLFDVLAGPPPESAHAWRLELPPPRHAALRDYRVAVWIDETGLPIDAEVRRCLAAAVDAVRAAGARVDASARPGVPIEQSLGVFWKLLAPILATSFPAHQLDALDQIAALVSDVETNTVAAFARDVGRKHRDWLSLHEERLQMCARWADFFRDYDVLLCPVSPVAAIEHDQAGAPLERKIPINGESRSYAEQFTWLGSIGVVLLPATVVPVGRTAQGLPVGIQIVGPSLEDRTPLAFATHLADLMGGFTPPPGF